MNRRSALAALLGTPLGTSLGLPLSPPLWSLLGTALSTRSGTAEAAPGSAAQPGGTEARDHFPFGPLGSPRSLETWPVQTHLGARTDLATLLRGRVTALQLMFTGCSATCPIQGALFAQAQRELAARPPGQPGQPAPATPAKPGAPAMPAPLAELQFVSLSIDALGDTPASLRTWLAGFNAQPGWTAALPRVGDVDAIIERLGSGGASRPTGRDPHTGQVYVFDRRARLVYRTPSMPRAAHIVEAMRGVAASG